MDVSLDQALAAALAGDGAFVVVTGAGVSAESGIPTFRGQDGYWTVGSRVYHPQELATHAAFRRMPEEVWRWYLYRLGVCRAAEPNPAHVALVELERALADRFLLVTQNVDGLHMRAGSSRARTYQIHGNIHFMRCAGAHGDEIMEIPAGVSGLGPEDPLPDQLRGLLRCARCEGWARPHVLWFDEYYDEELYRFESSLAAAASASVLVTAGTSGNTNLPNQMVALARRSGALLIDINPEDNPFGRAARAADGIFLRGSASQELPRVLAAVTSALRAEAGSRFLARGLLTPPVKEVSMTRSLWMDVEMPPTEPLAHGVRCDVCVVGAGIAGLSTAYQLARAGAGVVVLDEGPIGRGETGRTSAHLSNALDDRYEWLERVHSAERARLAAESHTAAIDCIAAICAEESIDCGFERVDGFLFAHDAKHAGELDRELAAAERAGVLVEREGASCFPFFDTGPCLRFRRQAIFHPLRYLAGLVRATQRWGGVIHTGVRVLDVESAAPCRVVTDGGVAVLADRVVVATNVPVHARFAIHTKQTAYRSYVLAFEVPHASVPNALYWDTADPYHYIRVAPGRGGGVEHLIVGGEDHRTGQGDDPELGWRRLEEWTRARFPMTGAIATRWSGQIIEPVDGLAYIGRSPGMNHPGVFLATGDSGNGLTHGTIAGMLLRDLIVGRDNPWEEVYDPGRVMARALPRLAKDNLATAAQYADWLRPGEAHAASEVARGSGAVVRRGWKPVAVYRDESGAVVERSAVCTHLGGVVSWNAAERTWDCPCHGSRFDRFGHVLNGPATRDLAPVSPARSDEAPEKPDQPSAAPPPPPASRR